MESLSTQPLASSMKSSAVISFGELYTALNPLTPTTSSKIQLAETMGASPSTEAEVKSTGKSSQAGPNSITASGFQKQ